MKKVFIVMMALCFGLVGLVSAESLDGKLLYELYTGIGGGVLVSDLTGNAKYPDNPDETRYLEDGFEIPDIGQGNFGARITGYIVPSVTASYVLYISSDDGGELWLSTDASPGNVRLVARCGTEPPIATGNGYAPANAWDDVDVEDSIEIGAGAISLQAGTKYYVRALYKEGGGGDHCQVAWESTAGGVAFGVIGAENLTLEPYGDWEATPPTTPPDDAREIPVGALTLSWNPPTVTPPGPIVKYNIYYGLDEVDIADPNSQSLAGSVPAGTTQFDVTVADVNLEYFWRVAVLLGDEFVLGDPNAAIGDVWSFESYRTLPRITRDPNDVWVFPGEPAVFTITAESPEPETSPITGYEWFKEQPGDDLSLIGEPGFSGADTDTLTVLAPEGIDEGDYYCAVTNSAGPAPSNSANLKTKQLVARYEFETIDVVEGYGVIYDSAPYDGFADGVIMHSGDPASMLVDEGVLGKAIGFNGADEHAIVGNVGISGDAPRSIAGWVKVDLSDNRPNRAEIFGFSTSDDHRSFDFCRRDNGRIDMHRGDNSDKGVGYTDGDWEHIALTYDGSTLRWYMNGVETVAGVNGGEIGDVDGPLDTGDYFVMAKRSYEDRWFRGQLDDVRVYDYPLNNDEVAGLYLLGQQGGNLCIDPPAGDVNGDCVVDFKDLFEVVPDYLNSGLVF